MSQPTIKLNTGAEIPAIGLGTWKSKPEEVVMAVRSALEIGYRHIDCAWGYMNENDVGEGIRQSGVPRSEIFITSKLWGTFHRKVEECLDQTLANLGTEYLDLYLVHWPIALNPNGNDSFMPMRPNGSRDIDESWNVKDTWKQMEAMLKKGKVKAIGVSNMSQKKLEELLPHVEIVPAVDQCEFHIYLPEHGLIDYLKSKGIVAEAYSPLGSSGTPLLEDGLVQELCDKYSAEPASVCLAYLVARDVVVLPKSVTPKRIESNFKGTIELLPKLEKSDVTKLDGLAASGKLTRFIMPPWPLDLGFEHWPIKVV